MVLVILLIYALVKVVGVIIVIMSRPQRNVVGATALARSRAATIDADASSISTSPWLDL